MYAIYGNIYHQYTPNVSINLPYMDPMGHVFHAKPRRKKPARRAGRASAPRTAARDPARVSPQGAGHPAAPEKGAV